MCWFHSGTTYREWLTKYGNNKRNSCKIWGKIVEISGKILDNSDLITKPKGFTMSFTQTAVQGCIKSEKVSHNPRQELLDFINSPLEIRVEDLIVWWGVSASPILLGDNLQVMQSPFLFSFIHFPFLIFPLLFSIPFLFGIYIMSLVTVTVAI